MPIRTFLSVTTAYVSHDGFLSYIIFKIKDFTFKYTTFFWLCQPKKTRNFPFRDKTALFGKNVKNILHFGWKYAKMYEYIIFFGK